MKPINSEEDIEVMKTFGERLSDLFAKERIDRHALAEDLGVHYNTICHWLSGKANPSLTHLYKIVEYFKDSVDVISTLFPELISKYWW